MIRPVISVVMTIYNHEKYLKKSIESIVNQSFKNWELIAIDNGSTDNSKLVLNKFKDRRIKKKYIKNNVGRTNCLNLALKRCKGKYIAIQDSDDVSRRNRLQIQLSFFKKNKKCLFLATNYSLSNNLKKKNIKINLKKRLTPLRNILFENQIAHSTIMFNKNLIKKIGFYPKKFLYSQDYMFYLKVFRKFKIYIINQNLVKINALHESSETIRIIKSNTAYLENIRRYIWVNKNFNLSLKEKIKVGFKIFINLIKILFLKLKIFI